MNSKILFDFCTFDVDILRSGLEDKDTRLFGGVKYKIDIYIYKRSTSIFSRLKTIPFTLLSEDFEGEDWVVKTTELYNNINTSISYCDLGSYTDKDGISYIKAFYIYIYQ